MLSKHITRAVSPLVTRTAIRLSNSVPVYSHVAQRMSLRRISSSAPVMMGALRCSRPLLVMSPSAEEPLDMAPQSAYEKFDGKLGAAAALLTAFLGGCLWWGHNDLSEDKQRQKAAMMEDVQEEFKTKFGLTEAQCEAATVIASSPDMRATIVAAAGQKFPADRAGEVFAANSIEGEDYVLAPWWKRAISFILDNMSTNALVFSLQTIIVRLRPDLEEAVLTGAAALVSSFLANVLVESLCLYMTNGKTLGKFIMGLKVMRDDQEKMDFFTALNQSVVRSLCTPLMFLPEFTILANNEASANRQLLHNWAAGTIVVDERAAAKQKREALEAAEED